jgi:DNA-binding XRE family transcriptional regulator
LPRRGVATRKGVLDTLKRHEIQVLRRAGHSQAEVAKLAGVSERSVRRIDEEPSVETVDDAGRAARLTVLEGGRSGIETSSNRSQASASDEAANDSAQLPTRTHG